MTTPAQQDMNTRMYINALREHRPLEKGDVGKWEQICAILESSYIANPGNIEVTYYCLLPSTPGLKTLMDAEEPPVQGESGPVVPELPQRAQLPAGCLPTTYEGDDWEATWDSSRLLSISPWLAKYLRYSNHKSPEGYIDFHVACALWALSTVAARRIFVSLADPVYTPLAIALVARTSLFAKTRTAQAAITVLKAASLGWLLGDDETTPQKLLSDMAAHIPPGNFDELDTRQQQAIERRLSMAGQRGWFYDEFNQLIDAMIRPGPMAEFAGLLRKLDDCHDEYKYSTRMHGQEIIDKPYIAFLANTTPANLRKHASRGASFWNDGFWARFALITPPEHAWKTKTMELGEVPVPDAIWQRLADWHRRLGEPFCQITSVADVKGKQTGRHEITREPLPQIEVACDDDAYAAYVHYREALRSLIANMDNHDLDGSYVRLSDKALRIAALIASLENQNRITLAIWTLSQEIAEMLRRNLHELYGQVSANLPDDEPMEVTLGSFLETQKRALTVREICQYAPRSVRKLKAKTIRELLSGMVKDGDVEVMCIGKKEMVQWIKKA